MDKGYKSYGQCLADDAAAHTMGQDPRISENALWLLFDTKDPLEGFEWL